MALINQNSIIGVTSITSPSASNVLTFHTNDTTERLRVSTSGVSFSGTNASLDTSGNLTIAGVLTYEDVTSVDSVGLSTFQNGIHVTGGSVGINETSPVRKLHVKADNAPVARFERDTSDGEILEIRDFNNNQIGGFGSDTGDLTLSAYNSNSLRIETSGSERLRITAAGRVRHQNSGGETIHELRRTDTNSSGSVGTINFTASDSHSVASISALGDGDNEGAHLIFRTTSAAADNSPYNAATPERFRIDSSGNAILKSANAAFKSENPNSSGDYVRMYAGAGTAQWDIYGNGELLRMSENSGNSAARVQFDLPTTHRSTSNTTGAAAITAKQEVNNGGYSIYVGKNSSDSTVYYVTHNGRVGATEGIIFGSDTADGNVLDDYEEGSYRSNSYIRLYDPNNTSSSFPILNTAAWNSQGYYTKTGGNVLVNYRIQSPLNSNISNLSSTTYDSYLIRITLPFTVGSLGRDTTSYARNTACGVFFCSQMDTDHPFFMQQQYGEDYATIHSIGTWGDMRTRMTSSANYQWWFSINYTAS